MSPKKEVSDEKGKKQKKYQWFGFGSYAGPGETGAFNPANIRADPGIFDKLFELFGVKEKTKEDFKKDNE